MSVTEYLVWDALNGEEADAKRIGATSPENAALAFADRDADGLTEGCYDCRDGHDICVRVPATLELVTYAVTVEMVPRFRATLVQPDERAAP